MTTPSANQTLPHQQSNDSGPSKAPLLIIDTNILIEIPRIVDFDWKQPEVELYILHSVLDELNSLMRDRSQESKARAAQSAYMLLSNLMNRAIEGSIPLSGGKVRLFFCPSPTQGVPSLNLRMVDDQLLAFGQQLERTNPGRLCVLVTMDRDLVDRAENLEPKVRTISPSQARIKENLPKFLRRKVEARQVEIRTNTGLVEQRQAQEKLRRSPRSSPSPEERLKRQVRKFHSQIIAARHRAILSITPLQARLALVNHLVALLEKSPRRIVLLFVENSSMAEFWAAEIRASSGLKSKDVIIFRDQALSLKDPPRVVIYRHDQIQARAKHHLARLQKASLLATVIVDHGDNVSPEQLLLLLLGNHQFIGFTRFQPSEMQFAEGRRFVPSRSGRLLHHFFANQSVLCYTFVDGEKDGWLQPFELIRQPVSWQDWEAEEDQDLKQQFDSSYQKAMKDHPNLKIGYFWDELQELLGLVADSNAAKLFALQEQQEELAQGAHNKLSKVLALAPQSHGETKPRNLIFDPSGVWALKINEELTKLGLAAAHMDRDTAIEKWEQSWNDFETGKLAALILQVVPPTIFSKKAHISRLVFMTPNYSHNELASMLDWTLMHTHPTVQPVELHVLYVSNTQEEQNMRDFAESVCGLHFQ